jgi:hypothetical protein
MADPLSMYVPIKQDATSQAAAAQAAKVFVTNVKDGLDESQIVHYAKLVLIPNLNGKGIQAIFLSTEFDGGMNPYLKFFWQNEDTQAAFAGIAAIALNRPDPPVTDLTGFTNFVNSTNLSAPADLYGAYTKTVKQINAKKKPVKAAAAKVKQTAGKAKQAVASKVAGKKKK